MIDDNAYTGLVLKALRFAADKHRNQRRKNSRGTPYINHIIEVAEMLWNCGESIDIITILGGILHDVLEDTDADPVEIESIFGEDVLLLVQEVSDDKSLPKMVRKKLQIDNASKKSGRAKLVSLADKICNLHDLIYCPPDAWSSERRKGYLEWSVKVVDGLRGVNSSLDSLFDEMAAEARNKLNKRTVDFEL